MRDDVRQILQDMNLYEHYCSHEEFRDCVDRSLIPTDQQQQQSVEWVDEPLPPHMIQYMNYYRTGIQTIDKEPMTPRDKLYLRRLYGILKKIYYHVFDIDGLRSLLDGEPRRTARLINAIIPLPLSGRNRNSLLPGMVDLFLMPIRNREYHRTQESYQVAIDQFLKMVEIVVHHGARVDLPELFLQIPRHDCSCYSRTRNRDGFCHFCWNLITDLPLLPTFVEKFGLDLDQPFFLQKNIVSYLNRAIRSDYKEIYMWDRRDPPRDPPYYSYYNPLKFNKFILGLLELGANPNGIPGEETSPFINAVTIGNVPVALELLKRGARVTDADVKKIREMLLSFPQNPFRESWSSINSASPYIWKSMTHRQKLISLYAVMPILIRRRFLACLLGVPSYLGATPQSFEVFLDPRTRQMSRQLRKRSSSTTGKMLADELKKYILSLTGLQKEILQDEEHIQKVITENIDLVLDSLRADLRTLQKLFSRTFDSEEQAMDHLMMILRARLPCQGLWTERLIRTIIEKRFLLSPTRTTKWKWSLG